MRFIHKKQMVKSDIHLLELADGIKSALDNAGFLTIKSILECSTSDISNRIGVDQYVGQIIIEEAKRVTKEMAKEPPVPDEKTFTPPEVTIKREEI
jgi:hypothetical protein